MIYGLEDISSNSTDIFEADSEPKFSMIIFTPIDSPREIKLSFPELTETLLKKIYQIFLKLS